MQINLQIYNLSLIPKCLLQYQSMIFMNSKKIKIPKMFWVQVLRAMLQEQFINNLQNNMLQRSLKRSQTKKISLMSKINIIFSPNWQLANIIQKHQNIVQLIDRFQTDEKIYLVLEYCQGGELFDLLQKEGKIDQSYAKKIVRQIAKAILYYQQQEYVHRDLKLNNILLLNHKRNSPLKLIDFGCATKIKKGENLKMPVGTVFYTAPEVIEGSYNQLCDIWSFGIILYILLIGYPPYYGQTQDEILDMIRESDYTYEIDQDETISQEALNLLSRCLTRPEKRITINEILEHPWMKSNESDTSL